MTASRDSCRSVRLASSWGWFDQLLAINDGRFFQNGLPGKTADGGLESRACAAKPLRLIRAPWRRRNTATMTTSTQTGTWTPWTSTSSQVGWWTHGSETGKTGYSVGQIGRWTLDSWI